MCACAWLCSDEGCRLSSSWSACCTDRACNHGKLPSPELKLRLRLLSQDLLTEQAQEDTEGGVSAGSWDV